MATAPPIDNNPLIPRTTPSFDPEGVPPFKRTVPPFLASRLDAAKASSAKPVNAARFTTLPAPSASTCVAPPVIVVSLPRSTTPPLNALIDRWPNVEDDDPP